MPPQIVFENSAYSPEGVTLRKLESLDYSPSKWPQTKQRLRGMTCFNAELTEVGVPAYQGKVPSELDRVVEGRMPVDAFSLTMRSWRLSADADERQTYKICLNAFLDEVTQLTKLPAAAAVMVGKIIGNLLKTNAVSDVLAVVLKLMLSDWLREVGAPAFTATMSALRELGVEYLRADLMLARRLRHSPGYPFLPEDLLASVGYAVQQNPHQLPDSKSNSTTQQSNPVRLNGAHVFETAASISGAVSANDASGGLAVFLDRLSTQVQLSQSTSQPAHGTTAKQRPQHSADSRQQLGEIVYTTEWLLPLTAIEVQTYGSDCSSGMLDFVNIIHDNIDISDPGRDGVDKISFICNQLSESMVQQHVSVIMKVCHEQVASQYDGQLGEFVLWLAWYITLERARVEENYHELYLNLLGKLSSAGLKTILPACAQMCAYFIVLVLDLSHEMLHPRLELKMEVSKLAHFLGLIAAYPGSKVSIPDFLEPRRLVETMRQSVTRNNADASAREPLQAIVLDEKDNSLDDGVISATNLTDNESEPNTTNGSVCVDRSNVSKAPVNVRHSYKLIETVLAVACALIKPALSRSCRTNAASATSGYVLRQLKYLREYHGVCHEQGRFEIERLLEMLPLLLHDPKLKAWLDGKSDKPDFPKIILGTELPQPKTKTISPPRAAGKALSRLHGAASELHASTDFDADGSFAPQHARSGVTQNDFFSKLGSIAFSPVNGTSNMGASSLSLPALSSSYFTVPSALLKNSELHLWESSAGMKSNANSDDAADWQRASLSQPASAEAAVVDPAIISAGSLSREQTPTASKVPADSGLQSNMLPSTAVAEDAIVAASLLQRDEKYSTPIAPPRGGDSSDGINGHLLNSTTETAKSYEHLLQQLNIPELELKVLPFVSEVDGAVLTRDVSYADQNPAAAVAVATTDDAATSGVLRPQRRLPVFMHNNDIWWALDELRSVGPLLSPVQVRTLPVYQELDGGGVRRSNGIDEQWLTKMLTPLLESHCATFKPLQMLRECCGHKVDLLQYALSGLVQYSRDGAELFKNRVPAIISPTIAILICKDFAFDVYALHLQLNAEMMSRYMASALTDCMYRTRLRPGLYDLLFRLIIADIFDGISLENSMPADTRTELEGILRFVADECGAVIKQYVAYKTIRYSRRELNLIPLMHDQVSQRHTLVSTCNNEIRAAAGAHLASRMDQFHEGNSKLPLRLRYRLDGTPPAELTAPYNIIRRRVHGFVNNYDFVTRQRLP